MIISIRLGEVRSLFGSSSSSSISFLYALADNDLGLRITGGHSLPNCMEVSACIQHIDIHHRNYLILKNAVKEGEKTLPNTRIDRSKDSRR